MMDNIDNNSVYSTVNTIENFNN